jgi:hypothetical protein
MARKEVMSKKHCPYTRSGEPEGYVQWHHWAERMSKRYVQEKCQKCGLYHLWKRKPLTSPPKTLASELDGVIENICMHSVRDTDGKVTIVYEGLSPAQIKTAILDTIKSKLPERRLTDIGQNQSAYDQNIGFNECLRAVKESLLEEK